MQPSLLAAAGLAGLGLALFALERARPLRHARAARRPRLFVNAAVSALALVTAGLAVRPVAEGVLGWTAAERFGLLVALDLPPLAEWLAAALLLDLSFYYWHRANHRWGPLWRFHNVHHVDPDLDVTTALRFHFGEVALSAGFRAVQVLLIAPATAAYLAYEVLFQANTLFHHSNVRLPLPPERILNWILVTPRMHGIHHSQVQGETESNYSVVFPWWDRLHGSLRLGIPQREITVGVPGYARPEDNRLDSLLAMPFRPQRDYWQERRRPSRAGQYGVGPSCMLE
jgi:sterol desaturase/sphingolipid hydroxylase (fatty acid hydroxylase superfamily)